MLYTDENVINQKVISLNLIFDYPVRWSKYQVIRDNNWDICISFKNWKLQVITSTIQVDNKNLKCLSYDVKEFSQNDTDTILTIGSFSEKDIEIVKAALYSFYYIGNPLLGEVIWESDFAAIYRRSNIYKPENYPVTNKCSGEGMAIGSVEILEGIVKNYFPEDFQQYKLKICRLSDFEVKLLLYDVIKNDRSSLEKI